MIEVQRQFSFVFVIMHLIIFRQIFILRYTSQILDLYHKFIPAFRANQKCTGIWSTHPGFILNGWQRNWIWI